MDLKVYTAAVPQVSLHKHNDNHVLAGIYLGYVPSILVKPPFQKAVDNNACLGQNFKEFYKLCTDVTGVKEHVYSLSLH